MYLGLVLLGGSTGSDTFRVRNVSGDPLYDKDPGGVPPPCGEMYHKGNLPATIPPIVDAMREAGLE